MTTDLDQLDAIELLATAEPASRLDTPQSRTSGPPPGSERIARRPWLLGAVGIGIIGALALRLAAANEFGDLDGHVTTITSAFCSGLVGVGLLATAAQRDRFGPSLGWIAAVTGLAWGALNWISPPFAAGTDNWDTDAQAALAVLGTGNGLLIAGIVALALVRRAPTLTAAATTVAGLLTLVAHTIWLREEWAAIVTLFLGFSLVLLAWDRSPRYEPAFPTPGDPPRITRAALSLIAVAFCGTAIQLWSSRRGEIPRAVPAIGVCVVLLGAAFASMVRVRKEIERRETALSEWTSWMREMRTNHFRDELENFTSRPPELPAEALRVEPPRPLSFPNLSIPDAVAASGTAASATRPSAALRDPAIAEIRAVDLANAAAELGVNEPVAAGHAATTGQRATLDRVEVGPVADRPPSRPVADSPRASGLVADQRPEEADSAEAARPLPRVVAPETAKSSTTERRTFSGLLTDDDRAKLTPVVDIDALERWLTGPAADGRTSPLLVAIEAVSLARFDRLDGPGQLAVQAAAGAAMAASLPGAALVARIDGPYFMACFESLPNTELLALNKRVLALLRDTITLDGRQFALDGTLALLRPAQGAGFDQVVDEAVMGLIRARRLEAASGRRRL